MGYSVDRGWADQPVLVKQVLAVCKRNAPHLVDFEVSNWKEDSKHSVDFSLVAKGGSVACRLRRSHIKWRDLTLRAYRSNGARTELDKISDGSFGALAYFYGWVNDQDIISEWILADIQKIIRDGILNGRDVQHNKDGTTGFIVISYLELDGGGYLFNRRMDDHS